MKECLCLVVWWWEYVEIFLSLVSQVRLTMYLSWTRHERCIGCVLLTSRTQERLGSRFVATYVCFYAVGYDSEDLMSINRKIRRLWVGNASFFTENTWVAVLSVLPLFVDHQNCEVWKARNGERFEGDITKDSSGRLALIGN